MNALEILEALVARSPGLIDGDEDSMSGADVVEELSQLLERADPPLQTLLMITAVEARKDEPT